MPAVVVARLLLASACAVAGAAWAQTTELARSPALECLTPGPDARSKLAYPPEMLERKEGATIEVELSFTGPDTAPQIRVTEDMPHSSVLEDAVRRHVSQFRVPCLEPGKGKVVMRQTYVFTPGDGREVAASQPVDQADKQRRVAMLCLKHRRGAERPEYPDAARRDDAQGPVLLRMRFTRPDSPPETTVLASTTGHLKRAVLQYAEGLRLPCMTEGPIELTLIYQYQLLGAERRVFKDASLTQLLASAKDLRVPAYFDFNAMGCPFDLRMVYMRPYLDNSLLELDSAMPSRQPFKDWLAGLTLNLPEKTNLSMLGSDLTVRVPCGKLDL